MRRAEAGIGGHGGHVRREGDEHAGAAGKRALGGNIDDHGDRGGVKIFDDLFGGIEQAARGIQPDDEAFVALVGSRFEGAVDVSGSGGSDSPVNLDQADLSGAGRPAEEQPQNQHGP